MKQIIMTLVLPAFIFLNVALGTIYIWNKAGMFTCSEEVSK